MKKELPLVSLVMVTYNQSDFIIDALNGAVNQTYTPLEIVVSDDCSTDNTFDLIKEFVKAYTGPHKFVLNRNEENLGISRNFQKLIDISTGEFIIDQAGDDISLPTRVEEIITDWLNNNKRIHAYFSNAYIIDENGKVTGEYFKGIPQYCSSIQDFLSARFTITRVFTPLVWMLGSTGAYSRDLFDKFSNMDPMVLQEDGVFSFRALLLGGLKYIDKPLVQYRRHSNAISNPKNLGNRLKLLKREYLYFENQYKDARTFKASKDVICKIRFYRNLSYIKHFIFSIPRINLLFLKGLIFVNRFLK